MTTCGRFSVMTSLTSGDVVPPGEVLPWGFGQRDHGESEHFAARLEVPAHRDLVVGEGDVGVDATAQHEPGDGNDVVRALALDEWVLRRKVGAADDVEVIAGERPGAGDEGAVLDALIGDSAFERVEQVFVGVDPDHDNAADVGFMGMHWWFSVDHHMTGTCR